MSVKKIREKSGNLKWMISGNPGNCIHILGDKTVPKTKKRGTRKNFGIIFLILP